MQNQGQKLNVKAFFIYIWWEGKRQSGHRPTAEPHFKQEGSGHKCIIDYTLKRDSLLKKRLASIYLLVSDSQSITYVVCRFVPAGHRADNLQHMTRMDADKV